MTNKFKKGQKVFVKIPIMNHKYKGIIEGFSPASSFTEWLYRIRLEDGHLCFSYGQFIEERRSEVNLKEDKMETILKQITDKIDGELETIRKTGFTTDDPFRVPTEETIYYEGKEVALKDLKTWIQNNIKGGVR